MAGFVLAVVSSLVASALVLVLGWLTSAVTRGRLVRILCRLTGLGLTRAYQSQKDANQELPKELAKARWLKVHAGRGNELTRDSFAT